MASHEGSTRIIVIALFANLGIAITKFAGALFTKSASMMAESIHSLADCTNQVFLLVGAKASRKPADEKHPLGYGLWFRFCWHTKSNLCSINAPEKAIKLQFPEIKWLFVEPDQSE